MEISPELVQAAFTLLTTLLSWGAYELAQYIRKKGGSEKMASVIWQVQEIVTSAVAEAEVVMVREAKDAGVWDAARRKYVKEEIVGKIKDNLTADASKFIIKNFGSLDGYIRGRIEADIAKAKKGDGG